LSETPKIVAIAGPNGSGKSTIFPIVSPCGLYINADEIMARKGCTALEAAREAEKLREYCLDGHKDFTFETVLSTDRNLDLLRRAKERGYEIEGIFVLTADTALNVLRVASRVSNGGHDVPIGKIRSRYMKSLDNIPRFVALCDRCLILDNTDEPSIIFRKDATGHAMTENPFWSAVRIQALIEADL
jgi:predicted ABC-type ATPase